MSKAHVWQNINSRWWLSESWWTKQTEIKRNEQQSPTIALNIARTGAQTTEGIVGERIFVHNDKRSMRILIRLIQSLSPANSAQLTKRLHCCRVIEASHTNLIYDFVYSQHFTKRHQLILATEGIVTTFEGNTAKMLGKLWKILQTSSKSCAVFSAFCCCCYWGKFVADRHSSDFEAMCLISYMCQNNHYHKQLTETVEITHSLARVQLKAHA